MKTFEEYSEGVWKLAKYPKAGENLIYPVLGLVGESSEVLDKVIQLSCDISNAELKTGLIKELGDVLWYTNALATDIGYSLQELSNAIYLSTYTCVIDSDTLIAASVDLSKHAGVLAEKAKKLWRDYGITAGKDICEPSLRNAIIDGLSNVLYDIANIATKIGSSLEEVAQTNYTKLVDRYERGVIHGSGDNR